jgi:hypothetical protein
MPGLGALAMMTRVQPALGEDDAVWLENSIGMFCRTFKPTAAFQPVVAENNNPRCG